MEPTPHPKLNAADLVQFMQKLPPGYLRNIVPPDARLVEQRLLQQAHDAEQQWLTDLLQFSLAAAGFASDEASLPALLPRLCYRTYSDGTVVVAIDARPKTAEQPATLGRPLFGFGPANFERLAWEPARWGFIRRVLDGERALLFELRQHAGAEPYPFTVPEVEQPRLSELLGRYAYQPKPGCNPAADGPVKASEDEGTPPAVL